MVHQLLMGIGRYQEDFTVSWVGTCDGSYHHGLLNTERQPFQHI
jgi:hypothetical protein